MPFPWDLVIGGGLGIASKIFGNRKSARTATSDFSRTDTEQYAPEYSPLQSLLISNVMRRLQSPSALPAGYAATGIGNINNISQLLRSRLENDLTARGLAGSPVAAAASASGEQARGTNIAQFQNQLPILERELQNQDLAAAMNFLRTAPMTRSITGRGTEVAPGSAMSAGLGGLAGLLGELFRRGSLGGGKNTPVWGG